MARRRKKRTLKPRTPARIKKKRARSARGHQHPELAGLLLVALGVFLASVLFLIGISTQFRLRGVRYALVGLGATLLVLSLVQLTQIAAPP